MYKYRLMFVFFHFKYFEIVHLQCIYFRYGRKMRRNPYFFLLVCLGVEVGARKHHLIIGKQI